MSNRNINKKNIALKAASFTVAAASGIHAIEGDRLIGEIPMNEDDLAFVSGTYQIGTMGWIAGAILLFGASRMDNQQARNWIVGVFGMLFGFLALGSLTLTGGEIEVGPAMLGVAAALAFYGRKADADVAVNPFQVGALV